MATDNNNGGKAKIKINRKMRTWNKFKKYIIGGGLAIIVIVVAAIVVTRVAKNSTKTRTIDNKTVAEATTSQKETSSSSEESTEESIQQTTTAAVKTTGTALTISGTADEEDYQAGTFYDDAAFLGDSVISGIGYYGYVSSDRVISDANMTTDKAMNYVDQVVELNPSTVYIMVGLNDFNYGTRSAEDAYGYMKQLVEALQEKLPNASIVVLSVTPISSTYEAKSSVNITQDALNTYNGLLKTGASEVGYTYINVADAFKDSDGYLTSTMTNAGYELKPVYYPFLLNKIAEVLQ